MESATPEKYSAEEWEHFRKRFSNSILKTAEIAELGRSVGVSWPFKGNGETPEKYIQFTFEELQSVPGLIGKKRRVNDLMDILREILAFDDPFSSMMDTVEKRSNEDRTYEVILKKLEIPEDYPVGLMYFSNKTSDQLYNKGIKTLIEAIRFGGRSLAKTNSENDLHSFINGLILANEATIQKHLPFRIGQTGLHLPEAVSLLARSIDEPTRIELLNQAGISLTDSEKSVEETVDKKSLEPSLKIISIRFNEICSWFRNQAQELKELCSSRESVERYFLPINDAQIERVSIALAMTHLGSTDTLRNGIFKKVSNLFKR